MDRLGVDSNEAKLAFENLEPLADYEAAGALQVVDGDSDKDNSTLKLADELAAAYGDIGEEAEVIRAWPRQEFDALADIVFDVTDSSYREVKTAIDKISYLQKAKLLSQQLKNSQLQRKFEYRLELLTDLGTLLKVREKDLARDISWQTPTPRYGYDIPKIIEASGLAEEYSQIFDRSLELYSLLDIKYPNIAPLALLCGHKCRWQLTISLNGIVELIESKDERLDLLGQKILNTIKTYHPLVFEFLSSSLDKNRWLTD